MASLTWKDAPPHYLWRAIDIDGSVYFYAHQPVFIERYGKWFITGDRKGSARSVYYGGEVPAPGMDGAAESLQERPERGIST